MELIDVLKHTGTTRYFKTDDVPDEVLWRAFDAARFAPQGGNRQPVRWVVVRDPENKRQLKEWYLPPWNAYVAGITQRQVSIGAAERTLKAAIHFADHLDEVPAIVVACAELSGIHPTDNQLGRLSVVGGASIYPTVQSFMLALRDQGVGSALTTLLCMAEPQVKELLGIPEDVITAAHVAIGYPDQPWPRKLTRLPVKEIAYVDQYGGSPLSEG
ncbi:MAG TPA: nitroreductase family protein [Solirubrobacteraceae bacterium]|nr:nitroreductase family protein [Solirubrobacteraceae bacterium]